MNIPSKIKKHQTRTHIKDKKKEKWAWLITETFTHFFPTVKGSFRCIWFCFFAAQKKIEHSIFSIQLRSFQYKSQHKLNSKRSANSCWIMVNFLIELAILRWIVFSKTFATFTAKVLLLFAHFESYQINAIETNKRRMRGNAHYYRNRPQLYLDWNHFYRIHRLW